MTLFATDREKLEFLLTTTAFEVEGLLTAMGKETTEENRPKYVTNYIGSKQKLIDWIWSNTPDGVNRVFDGFSGSSVVGYMYKTKGMEVITNDRLRFCHHAARAIVENNSVQITESEMEDLMVDNPKAGTFIQDTFDGIFFAKGIHRVIDTLRANIDAFSGYKKDIALFALGKTCMSSQGGFGHFSASTPNARQDSPEAFKERLAKNIEKINALVFDNGKENQANHGDINQVLPRVKVDLAYFDPPYATEFSSTNYEKSYHFVEGLMTYWKGMEINKNSKTRTYVTDHKSVSKSNALEFFQTFLGNATHIGHWLISYRDKAYPNEKEMKDIIGSLGWSVSMKSKNHRYSITKNHGDASHAIEQLFVCKLEKGAAKASETKPSPNPRCHAHIPVEIETPLTANADLRPDGDPNFQFILCRVGANKNGDHFNLEELKSRHHTAINKKIDLMHSQNMADIVGGIVSTNFVEDESGGYITGVGELYTQDTSHARLAYKLLKKGIVSQVSMECDYEQGECSICHKMVSSKTDYCQHLRRYKGGVYQGQPVFEMLHGVTFTGLGLLDRSGADENARITQVASKEDPKASSKTPPEEPDVNPQTLPEQPSQKEKPSIRKNEGESELSKPAEDPKPPQKEAANEGGGKDSGGAADPEKKALIEENQQLKQQLMDLQKKLEQLEAEQKAAANRTRAEKFLTDVELNKGLKFADRDAELDRLAGLSDEAYSACVAVYDQLPDIQTEEGKPSEEASKAKASNHASASTQLNGKGQIRPKDVEDERPHDLGLNLKKGFELAFKSRRENTGL